jgi:hypothetical protein
MNSYHEDPGSSTATLIRQIREWLDTPLTEAELTALVRDLSDQLDEAYADSSCLRVERDWLLAEADDDTRARYFHARNSGKGLTKND